MTKEDSLSLCIITKNDEEYIADCIRQFGDTVDEVIVADLGSEDKTAEIAQMEGAKVYSVDWARDFGAVKNCCMDNAQGRWILFLQANETVLPDYIEKIRFLIKNPNAEAYITFVDFNSESFGVYSPLQSLRLIRNRKEMRFKYRSFEIIPDESITGLLDSGIQIKQEYDAMLSWQLKERLEILRGELEENPKDTYLQYIAGIVLLNEGRFEESIEKLEGARTSAVFGHIYVPHLFKLLSWAYLYIERCAEAAEILNEGIENFPFYSDLLVLRGEALRQLDQPDKAIEDLKRCVEIRALPNQFPLMPEIPTGYILSSISEIYENEFDYTQALDYYLQSCELDSTDIEILDKTCEIIEKTGASEDAKNLIEMISEHEDSELLEKIISLLMKHHLYDCILLKQEKIEELLGEKRGSEIKISCRIMIGDMETGDIDLDECGHEVLLRRLEGCWLVGGSGRADSILNKAVLREDIPDIYFSIQAVFSRGEYGEADLTPDEYETVSMVYNDMLWKGEKGKALSLLQLLLLKSRDAQYTELALPWAKNGNIEVIKAIYSCMPDEAGKKEFMRKVTGELIWFGHTDKAAELIERYDVELPQEFELILWSEKMIMSMNEITSGITGGRIEYKKPEADKGLYDFYGALCEKENEEAEKREDIDSAELYGQIGSLYLKKGKEIEALSAYLGALYIDPFNTNVHRETLKIVDRNPNIISLAVKIGEQSGLFSSEGDISSFIRGLKYFYEGDFVYALDIFLRPGRMFNVYTLACRRLGDIKEDNNLTETEDSETILAEARICLGYMAYRFSEYNGILAKRQLEKIIDLCSIMR